MAKSLSTFRQDGKLDHEPTLGVKDWCKYLSHSGRHSSAPISFSSVQKVSASAQTLQVCALPFQALFFVKPFLLPLWIRKLKPMAAG